jgi:hypothetical protein
MKPATKQRFKVRRVLLSWLFVVGACYGAARAQDAYSVAQQFELRQDNIHGKIELLMDVRLTATVREELWGKGDWSFVLPSSSELSKKFSQSPPRNAILRITNDTGQVAAERELGVPLAKVEVWTPTAKGGQKYLLTADYSVGVGSYNGLATTLLEVHNATFQDVEAFDAGTGQKEPIRLVRSLKSDWRIVADDRAPELLSLSCHPQNDAGFVLDYVRYRFDGARWLKYKRQEAGMWESDQPFPSRTAFPK